MTFYRILFGNLLENVMIVNPMYTASLTEQQRTWFFAEYQAAAKDEVVGVLLALFLGSFGIHKFYMGETGWGVLYILLSWTGIPALLGFIECFLMPGRVRAYNAVQAQIITNGILATNIPAANIPSYAANTPPPPAANLTPAMCPACGGLVATGATFCTHCGAGMAATA